MERVVDRLECFIDQLDRLDQLRFAFLEFITLDGRIGKTLVVFQNARQDRQIVFIELVQLRIDGAVFAIHDVDLLEQFTGLIKTVGDFFIGKIFVQIVDLIDELFRIGERLLFFLDFRLFLVFFLFYPAALLCQFSEC